MGFTCFVRDRWFLFFLFWVVIIFIVSGYYDLSGMQTLGLVLINFAGHSFLGFSDDQGKECDREKVSDCRRIISEHDTKPNAELTTQYVAQ